jgi:hypothetical protein
MYLIKEKKIRDVSTYKEKKTGDVSKYKKEKVTKSDILLAQAFCGLLIFTILAAFVIDANV